MAGVYRVHLVEVGDLEQKYTFDIEVDGSMNPVKGLPFFGVWGSLADEDNWYRCVLLNDGRIDFGPGCEGERYYRTNIRERKLSEGEMVTVWDWDPE